MRRRLLHLNEWCNGGRLQYVRGAIVVRTVAMGMNLRQQLAATQNFGVELINVVSACIPVSIVDACVAYQFGPVEKGIDGHSFWCYSAFWILLGLCYFEVKKLLQSSTRFISGHPV